jgi:multimeric flavodoxin WrbA
MAIVGISGSPIPDGNTDRITKAILEESGKETTFINLSTLSYVPCRACAHLCATSNMCGLEDDLLSYLQEIRDADALVLSSPIHHGNMTGWMYSFVTRLWCFGHMNMVLKDKPTVFVSTGIAEEERQRGSQVFQDRFARGHQLKVLGHLYYRSLIPPCLKCGAGHICRRGGLWYLLGKNEEALKSFEFTEDKFRRFEDDPETADKVKKYGALLANL